MAHKQDSMGAERDDKTAELPAARLEALLEKSMRPELPQALGPCVLLHKLADRPSCRVYLGTSAALEDHQRICVVKSVRPEAAARAGFAERFSAAMRHLVHLDHRNVAQVFDSGEVDGVLYLAREHVLGCRLDELLAASADKGVPLPLDLALFVGVDVLRGLYHALRQHGDEGAPLGLWHGRLRPRSVLLSTDGVVKLIGLDREWEPFPLDTRDSGFLATVEEGDMGEDAGTRFDVFAAGCLLEALLRGPLAGERLAPTHEGLALDLGTLIARATSPEPAHRPRDVGAVLRPLRAALHRVNPRCGPPALAKLMRTVMPDVLIERAALLDSLLETDASAARAEATKSTRRTKLLLEDTDLAVRLRALERAQALGKTAVTPGLLPGTKYRILRPIGEGGMGTVYAAEHVHLEKVFAVKVLRPTRPGAEDRDRLLREARAASRLRHPNIVSVSDFGETPDGRVFFVMEHLEGATLGEILATEQRLDQGRAVEILVQACEGLQAAHRSGVVHRDVKPDNIFLVQEAGRETVKILDFGVAAIGGVGSERRGRLAGTPHYMSPERILFQPIDGRSDLYSLGVVAYEALSGRRPFGTSLLRELLRRHVEVAPEPLRLACPGRVHPALEAVVLKALSKKPWERYADADAMAEDLRAVRPLLRAPAAEGLVPLEVARRNESVQREIDEAWSRALEELQAADEQGSGPGPGRR